MADPFDDPNFDPFSDPYFDFGPPPRSSPDYGREIEAGLLGAGLGVGGTLLVDYLLHDSRHGKFGAPVSAVQTGRSGNVVPQGTQLGYHVAGLGPDQLLQLSQRVGNDLPFAQIPAAVSATFPANFSMLKAYYVTVPTQPGAQALIAEGIEGARNTTRNTSPWIVNLPNVGSIAPGGSVTGFAGI